jgi:uncharacterized membrane protein YuzA (DUF378 family)
MLIVNNNIMSKVAYILVLIGGLNWGLEALNFNLVYKLVGNWPTVESIIYILVGLSAVWLIVEKMRGKDCCSKSSSTM